MDLTSGIVFFFFTLKRHTGQRILVSLGFHGNTEGMNHGTMECQGNIMQLSCYSGWWFGTSIWHFPRNIGNLIIPIDELIFFRGVA